MIYLKKIKILKNIKNFKFIFQTSSHNLIDKNHLIHSRIDGRLWQNVHARIHQLKAHFFILSGA